MARPIGHLDTFLPQPGSEDQIGRHMMPNGQPPQFPRQPMYPEKASRPMMGQPMHQNMSTVSNGIQQQHSHPSSLSSQQSSRDASPVPHRLSSSHQPSPSATPPPYHATNQLPVASQPLRPLNGVQSVNSSAQGQFRPQLQPNFNSSAGPSVPSVQSGRMFEAVPPGSQPLNIPTSSDGQQMATHPPMPPMQSGQVISQPNYTPVQLNPTSSNAPVQSNPSSYAPVQLNPTSSYDSVHPNPTPSYAPVHPNPTPSYAPVHPNPTSSYAPVHSNPTPSYAPVHPNPTSSYVPVQPTFNYAPVQSNPTPSYAPVHPNPTSSYAPVATQFPPTSFHPPPSVPQAKPMVRTNALGTMPPSSNSQSQPPSSSHSQPLLQTIGTPSRMAAYGSPASPLRQPSLPGQNGPMSHGPPHALSSTYRPPTMPQGQTQGLSGPSTQQGPPRQPNQPMGSPNLVGMAPPPSTARFTGQNSPTPQQVMAPPPSRQPLAPPPMGIGQNGPSQQSTALPSRQPTTQQGMTPPLSRQPPPSMVSGQNAPYQQGMAPPPMRSGPNGPTTQQGMAPPLSRQPPPSMVSGQNAPYQQGMAPPPMGSGQNGPTTQQGLPPPPLFGPPRPNGPTTQQYSAPPTDNATLPPRYPQQATQQRPADANFNQQLAGLSVAQHGFNKLWGAEHFDLLQTRNILPPERVETPRVKLQQEFLDAVNCSPEIFRCTLTKIPETNSLLQKSRLPLGVLIHPFKDLNHLAVIQCQSIVRCRACRTYINPFVYFVDHKRWKCNLCFRVNELPEEFQFDPVSKTYGDPSRRPEIKSATIEFIAPSEYMLRPPQPAVYLFLLDVSCLASECGYLPLVCSTLLDELDKLPGDARTQVGFIAFDTALHFYNMADGLNQPQEMTVLDVDDVFLPTPDGLIVNLNENKELVKDLLRELPKRFSTSHDSNSSLGAALQAAYKLMSATGGRVTVFQACLPNFGPGALAAREDPSARASKDVAHLNPATDFYKRLALDCSGQQVAVDLFIVNQQYCDLATLSGVSRFSGGSIHHFPLFKAVDPLKAEALEQSLRRYLTRKLGLEAVMRIRCSRGLAIHTFHGNFFVRSTDLLSLPNVNPDAGFAMQVAVEESLAELHNVCFQAALLYTSSKGERRIRVHTLCLPVAANLTDVLHSADQQCIVGLLAKMAVDRSLQSSLGDAREAFINVAMDALAAFKLAQPGAASSGLAAPASLRLLPLYILALLKYVAFRTGQSTRLDDRVFAMCQMKTLPLNALMQEIYPDLYPVHRLSEQACIDVEGTPVPQPTRLHLSAEKLESAGAFLLDAGCHMTLFIGRNVGATFCQGVFGVNHFQEIPDNLLDLPVLETPESEQLRHFVAYLQSDKPWPSTMQVIRDDSADRGKFYERLLEDRTESSLSYYEFLQHLKTNIK